MNSKVHSVLKQAPSKREINKVILSISPKIEHPLFLHIKSRRSAIKDAIRVQLALSF